MAEALRQLGFVVKEDAENKTIYVEGRGGKIPIEKATLHVSLAGTAARFLTALCAAAPRGVFKIDGVPQMRKRPMKGLFDALTNQGAEIKYLGETGFFPIELNAHRLCGGEVEIDASESSQMLSALLMVAPLAASPLEIKLCGKVRWPFVEMTINQMGQFGFPAKLTHAANAITVPGGRYSIARAYAIEPDATAASYFAALPLVAAGNIAIPNLAAPKEGLQGDTQFLTVLEQIGAEVIATRGNVQVARKVGLKQLGVTRDFREFSDTFLTLAAIAPLFDGPTKITGIAHTRKQETDRVAGMARELKKLGQHVIETEDSLEIHPRPLTSGITIETYGDHRFAMSFAILGCHDLLGNGQPWLTIKNPACCAKTFPNFFDVLNELRTNSHLSS
jgi:3-phosphoshikimate 1-carboxyvinyltransferase